MLSGEAARVRPGERVGPYTVLAELASGGMGCVYLARSPGGRTVALKTVLPGGPEGGVSADGRRRFAREVALAQRVRGVFTASVVDADAEADVPWMATEYIAAPSLRELVAGCGTLPAPAVHWVAAGMAEALVSVHAAGLVHRDVKPSNVLLPAEGPRVIDFGISQTADVTRTHNILGTLAFIAPEQARGETTTPASDVFSLGATLFHLAVGRTPYRDSGVGTALEQLVRAGQGELDLDQLPAELDELIRPCLHPDPARRPTPVQLLQQCAPQLQLRPAAQGAADWLPSSWVAAIDTYRKRRTREAAEAAGRVDPDAATEVVPPAGHTEVLPPVGGPVRGGGRGGPERWRLWAAAVAGVLVLAVGVTGAVLKLGDGGGKPASGASGSTAKGTAVAPQDRLRFLPVTTSAAGTCPEGNPDAYTSEDGAYCLTVKPGASTAMEVERLQAAQAVYDEETTSWRVQITFTTEDGRLFSALTADVAGSSGPRQIAIVLGDRVLSAPVVYNTIPGGRIDITGGLTKEKAERLAFELGGR